MLLVYLISSFYSLNRLFCVWLYFQSQNGAYDQSLGFISLPRLIGQGLDMAFKVVQS